MHSILAYDVPRTADVGLPTKFRLNGGPASQPITGSIPVNRLRRWPSTNPSLVCSMLCANTWHLPNAVSMLTHSLPRWLDIETALGDCTVFSDCCMGVTMRVTLYFPVPETPVTRKHNTLANSNAGPLSATLGQHYSNQNPLRSNHYIQLWRYIFSEHFLKTKALNLATSNAILEMFIRTGVQKCQPFPTHITPLPPK